jgi:hypothetical protein
VAELVVLSCEHLDIFLPLVRIHQVSCTGVVSGSGGVTSFELRVDVWCSCPTCSTTRIRTYAGDAHHAASELWDGVHGRATGRTISRWVRKPFTFLAFLYKNAASKIIAAPYRTNCPSTCYFIFQHVIPFLSQLIICLQQFSSLSLKVGAVCGVARPLLRDPDTIRPRRDWFSSRCRHSHVGCDWLFLHCCINPCCLVLFFYWYKLS